MAPIRYFGLPKSERDESDSEPHHRDLPERGGVISWIQPQVLWMHISLILFYSTIAVYVLLHYTVNDYNCSKHLSIYSPALDSIKSYNDEYFKGTFNRPSKFRGTPSPELDAAWDNITQVDFVPFSKDELFKMGKGDQVELAVKFPKDKGGEYAGAPEVFHLLHCVDFLRRNTHYDYYADTYGAFQDGPVVVRTHLDHCLELLRINLMCTSDVSFLTFNWLKGQEHPTPNFNTKHRCRNFDKVWGWTKENQKKFGSAWRHGGEIELETYP